ncbi:MAG: AMP-binding protein [Clostridia bacterium]|nr:AMP-binding protein [Clostridia bacterium]
MKKAPLYETWEMNDFRELLDGIEKRYAVNCAYVWHDGYTDDGIITKSYTELAEDVKNLAAYLCAMGLEGKTVAVTGKNSYLWAVSYLAIGCGCGMIVPLDRDLRSDELSGLCTDAGCAAIFYTSDMEEKIAAMENPRLLRLPLSCAETYFSRGAELRAEGSMSYENHTVDPDAPGVLLYTSGTTGVAKGVLLSQHNICADIVNVCRRVKITGDDRVLSHLPLHHTYECTTSLAMLYSGGSIAFNDNLRRLPRDLSLFRPTMLVTVPAVLEFMAKFVRRSYADARGGKLLLGVQRAASGVTSKTLQLLSDKTGQKHKRRIFSTIDHFFGGKLRAILVGAAPLSPDTFRLFEGFGYAVYCGYGLTETAPISLMHDDFYRCADDTGFPVCGVEARIDSPDENGIGELCLRGPNVMLGYHNNPEATSEVLRDGWLYTGDLAQMTKSGAYRITGRKKSMIVSQSGKKIFPEELEAYLSRSPIVAECMVYAEEQDGNLRICAAVYPDKTETEKVLGCTEGDPAYAEKLRALLLELTREINNSLPPYKHIRRLIIRKTEFVKTTTKKIKRSAPENTEHPAGETVIS